MRGLSFAIVCYMHVQTQQAERARERAAQLQLDDEAAARLRREQEAGALRWQNHAYWSVQEIL